MSGKTATVVFRKCIDVLELWGIFPDEEKAMESVKSDSDIPDDIGVELVQFQDFEFLAEDLFEEQKCKIIDMPQICEIWGYLITDTVQ